MNDLTLIMTAVEARECISKINSSLTNIRSLVLDLYEREGWKALGYDNWRECVATEFGQHQSYLYRQLEAARIEKNISPIGENEEIPESQLRPLTKLEPEQQKEARHSILCLLSRWQGRIKKSETGKSGNSHRLLTTTLIGGKRMAINHVTFFLSGINHKASNALTSACTVV